jgi:hypothetical protein
MCAVLAILVFLGHLLPGIIQTYQTQEVPTVNALGWAVLYAFVADIVAITLFIVGLVAFAAIKHLFGVVQFEVWPRIFTVIIDSISRLQPDLLRDNFRRMEIGIHKNYESNHSHPEAGGERNEADKAITNLIVQSGLIPYSISTSSSDDRNSVLGTRCFYTEKSLTQKARFDELPKHAAIKLTDVDYYVHMPALLRRGLPIIMYTFVPLAVGGPGGLNTVYSMSTDDEVVFKVTGCESYRHKLWDYEMTTVSTMTWWGAWTYAVEQFIVPGTDNRRIVGFFPRRKIYTPIAWLLSFTTQLKRRTFQCGEWVTSRFFVADDSKSPLVEYVSLARPTQSFSVTLPLEVAYAIMQKVRTTDQKMPYSTVEGALRAVFASKRYLWWNQRCNVLTDCVLLTQACTTNLDLFGPPVVNQLTCPVTHHYTAFDVAHIWDEELPMLRSVIGGQFDWDRREPWSVSYVVPTRCMANDKATVERRINRIANKVVPPAVFNRYINEFASQLIPDEQVHTGVPTFIDEVIERQNRPSQRSIIRRAINWLYDARTVVVSAFQKREAYGKYSAPRNISPLPGTTKVLYSSYMYAFSEVLKSQPWYAFCQKPVEMAQSVVRILMGKTYVVQTDFSKFDGTHSRFLCNLEVTLLKRFFGEVYHQEVERLYWSQYKAKGYTSFGCQYDTGYSRLSGSPETSAFNSIDNAFVAFCAFRRGEHRMPNQITSAYQALGLYGGDDGLTAGLSPSLYAETASLLGLKLTPEVSQRGQRVKFMSRYFSNPWCGDCGSYTDVARQLGKLHLTHAGSDVSDDIVLYRKALGYLLTDRKTPFLGVWSAAVIALYAKTQRYALIEEGCEIPRVPGDERWFEQYDKQFQFPQAEETETIFEQIAQDLNTDYATLRNVEYDLERATSLVQMFPAATHFGKELKVEFPVKVDHGILVPSETVMINDAPSDVVSEPAAPTTTGQIGGQRSWHNMSRSKRKAVRAFAQIAAPSESAASVGPV